MKSRTTITIDTEVLKKLQKHCKETGQTVSPRIEILIKKYLQGDKNEK
ncbi:MAG: ribbon-helix-helix protein, CopG family [Selenomonadaceae bacterium]